jgi:DNA-binding NarL/FixJ family response regulator
VHNEREGRLRVLVADDNDDVRRGIVKLLDPGEFEIVAVVSSGRELVDAAVVLEPDVIVSDLMMPSLTGAQAFAMLRAAGHTIPFVLQTTTGRDAQAWLNMGALCVVDKFDLASDLVTAVRSAAAGKVFLSRSITKAR